MLVFWDEATLMEACSALSANGIVSAARFSRAAPRFEANPFVPIGTNWNENADFGYL